MSAEPIRKASCQIDLEQAFKDLPSLPTVVTKVLQIADNDRASASEIERAIACDQAITAKLLRVVNSPYFGLSGQIYDVAQAVVIMGFHQVRNLVLSIGAASTFHAKSPLSRQVQATLWKHAFGMAVGAEVIARKKNLDTRTVPTVFIGGMLANIGSLFLLREKPLDYVTLAKKAEVSGISYSVLEHEQFGISHAKIGAELCVRWRMPSEFVLLIGRHEGPFDGEPIPQLYSIHAADRLSQSLIKNADPTGLSWRADPQVEEWLNLTDEDRGWIYQESMMRLHSASEIMGILS